MADWLPRLGFTLFPFIGAAFGRAITKKSQDWYDTLKKPSWRPPKWAFPVAWSYLYGTMGYASFVIWNTGGFSGGSRNALILYGAQLAVNWAWTPIFFGAKNLGGGVATISVLWGLVAATGYEFYKIKPWAGYAFLPYLAWVSLATTLNYRTWKLNPKSIKDN